MSNVLKQYRVIPAEGGKRVINPNELLEEYLREKERKEKLRASLENRRQRAEGEDPEFDAGLLADEIEAQPDPKETAEQILRDARERADQLLNDAYARAKEIELNANQTAQTLLEEHKKLGFEEGAKAREAELEEFQRQLEDKDAMRGHALELKKQELEVEFQKQRDALEGEIIDALIPVFDKVFQIGLEHSRDMIFTLVRGTLLNVELGDHVKIRVSEEDKELIAERLDELTQHFGSDVQFELVHDSRQKGGQCQIETPFGVFDCGIDTEYNNLIDSIRALV